jgi:hypothetical protein
MPGPTADGFQTSRSVLGLDLEKIYIYFLEKRFSMLNRVEGQTGL